MALLPQTKRWGLSDRRSEAKCAAPLVTVQLGDLQAAAQAAWLYLVSPDREHRRARQASVCFASLANGDGPRSGVPSLEVAVAWLANQLCYLRLLYLAFLSLRASAAVDPTSG